MRIHKEGNTTIILTFLLIVALSVVVNVVESQQTVYHYILYVLMAVVFVFILCFFRSPSRNIVLKPYSILSAADGRVVCVEKAEEKEYFKKEMLQISVFMSPLQVHINRYPVSGNIEYTNHLPGKHFIAWLPKSSEENERNSIVLTTDKQKSILVRQIAGVLARRIVSYSSKGKVAKQGEELGFIKFGSRVDIYVPLDTRILVKTGDMVKAGKSVIAEF